MPKQNLRIEVIRSSSKNVSSTISTASALGIVASLREQYSDVVMTIIDTAADLQALIQRRPDVVFTGIYFLLDETAEGKKIWLADILDAEGIAYTGSNAVAHELGIDKQLAKQRMIDRGIETASFKLAKFNDPTRITKGSLQFPLFVKPSNKGGGRGIDEFSVVHDEQQLQTKVDSIHSTFHSDALVEEYLSGREFSVAVLARDDGSFLTMPLELVASADENGNRMLSETVKSSNTEEIVAVTNWDERRVLNDFALSAFQALGGYGYGRIDVRFNAAGVPQFLEANLIPSLTDGYGSFPKAYEMSGQGTYVSMLTRIVEAALERHPATTLTLV